MNTEMAGWKANLGVSEKQNRLIYANLLPKLAEKNQAYFGILYDGDRVVSIELSYVYLNTVYFAHGTYHPDYAHLSPGSVSTSKFIEYFHGKGYQDGDFLAGFAFYVNSWSERLEPTQDIEIFKVNRVFFYYAACSLLLKIKKKLLKLKSRLNTSPQNHAEN
jgi:hypothetical protein